MTVRKTDNLLWGDRTPAYVDRETGAAELLISTDTWDQWVKEGRLPPPCDTFPSGTPRWRWEDVDRKLPGRMGRTPSMPTRSRSTGGPRRR
jgi:hypothetical protein